MLFLVDLNRIHALLHGAGNVDPAQPRHGVQFHEVVVRLQIPDTLEPGLALGCPRPDVRVRGARGGRHAAHGPSGAAAGPSGAAAEPRVAGHGDKGAGGEVGEDGTVENPSVRLAAAVSVVFLHSWAE